MTDPALTAATWRTAIALTRLMRAKDTEAATDLYNDPDVNQPAVVTAFTAVAWPWSASKAGSW